MDILIGGDNFWFKYVFMFHVPLFFFLSGCTENLGKERTLIKDIWHKTVNILIPFFLFGIMAIVVNIINNGSLQNVGIYVKDLLLGGIRNNVPFADSLWFLTCIYVVEVIFTILKRIKNKPLVLIISVLISILAVTLIKPSPLVTPHMPYNVDSALYYIIFYCLGWISYNSINKWFETKNKIIKILTTLLVLILFVYSTLLLFGNDPLAGMWKIQYIGAYIKRIIRPLLLITLWINLASFIEKTSSNTKIDEIGKNTLYLCGSEKIAKILLNVTLSIFGININTKSPISILIITVLLLYISNKTIVVLYKNVIDRFRQVLRDD